MRVSVTSHEKSLRQLRCAVSRSTQVTLHHCHGGSMKDAGWHVGMAQKQNPFLQIPLHQLYHTGDLGIDYGYGVESWEDAFGKQMDHLEWVNGQLPYDIWELAKAWRDADHYQIR